MQTGCLVVELSSGVSVLSSLTLHQARLWHLYGYYSSLMCIGSAFGAITWISWMCSPSPLRTEIL